MPFAGIDELGGKAVVHLLPTLGIDVRFGLLPGGNEVYHFVDTPLITEIHLFDKGAATLHLVIPRYVVEPKEILFRAGGQVII